MSDLKGNLKRFETWLGQWSGQGSLPDKADLMVRVEACQKLSGAVIELLIEFYQETKLVAGSLALITESENGKIQMAISHMHHGSFVLCEIEDDPDVLALKHEDDAGRATTLSMLVEKGQLHINAVIKLHGHEHELANVVLSR